MQLLLDLAASCWQAVGVSLLLARVALLMSCTACRMMSSRCACSPARATSAGHDGSLVYTASKFVA
jgi:hypothetical protein